MAHEIAKPLYEGKAKALYTTGEPEELLMVYQDKVTAGNGEKEDYPADKGNICCQISTFLFNNLEANEIKTHFIANPSAGAMVVKKLDMIPIEVVVRNKAAGGLVRDIGVAKGTEIKPCVIEPFLKDDSRNDPLLNWDRVRVMGYDCGQIVRPTIIINNILTEIFDQCGIELVDFKLEFGYDADKNICVGDELSPDGMRLWQKGTQENYDKDIFREGDGSERLVEAYKYILESLSQIQSSDDDTTD